MEGTLCYQSVHWPLYYYPTSIGVPYSGTIHPEMHCSGCWMVRADTVVTVRMGNICYYVSNMASGDWWMVGTILQW